jgi:hypothetical protein
MAEDRPGLTHPSSAAANKLDAKRKNAAPPKRSGVLFDHDT